MVALSQQLLAHRHQMDMQQQYGGFAGGYAPAMPHAPVMPHAMPHPGYAPMPHPGYPSPRLLRPGYPPPLPHAAYPAVAPFQHPSSAPRPAPSRSRPRRPREDEPATVRLTRLGRPDGRFRMVLEPEQRRELEANFALTKGNVNCEELAHTLSALLQDGTGAALPTVSAKQVAGAVSSLRRAEG